MDDGNVMVGTAERPPKVFYNIDSSKLSLAEWRWGNPRLLMPLATLLGALFKACRLRLPCSTDDPPLRDLAAFEEPTLSEEELAILKPVAEPLAALGFVEPVCHRIDDPLHSTKQLWMTFRHASGEAFARAHWRRWATSGKSRLFAVISTELEDGSFLVSSSGAPDTLSPPSWQVERHVGASPADLWAAHRLLLSRGGAAALRVDDQAQARAALERQHAAARDFNLARKVFAPLTAAEHERQETASALSSPDGVSLEEATVLAEIRQMEGRKSGWGSLLVFAAVSLGLFLGLGATQQPFRFLMLLVAVLIVHEAGHFVVMRLFGYRNLRMFFIPFLGAAVSGRGNNVPGWKRGIVLLAGPLPGIALGVLLALAGMARGDALLKELALLSLVLNGLNLLPLLPLDGGRLAHLVLFSRHPALDVLFRVSAVMGFVLLGLLLKDKLVAAIALIMAFGVPMAFRSAELVRRLRGQGMGPVDGCDDADAAVPEATAVQIMRALPGAFPRGLTHRSKAQLTIQLFETLNARPPSPLASLLLCFFTAAGFFVAVVFSFAVAVSMHNNGAAAVVGNLFTQGQAYQRGASRVWHGAAHAKEPLAGGRFVASASFVDSSRAERVFAELQPQAPPEGAMALLGRTLILDFPSAGEKDAARWRLDLESRGGKQVCVGGDGGALNASICCLAPTAAKGKAIEEGLQSYFGMPRSFALLAPWGRELRGDTPEAEAWRLARRTYGALGAVPSVDPRNPESARLGKSLQAALGRGDIVEAAALRARRVALGKAGHLERLDKLRYDSGLDVGMVELYKKWVQAGADTAAGKEPAALRQEMARRMGTGASGALGLAGGGGMVVGDGASLRLDVSFNSLADGLPAALDWLGAQGCTELNFSVYALSDDDGEEDGVDSGR